MLEFYGRAIDRVKETFTRVKSPTTRDAPVLYLTERLLKADGLTFIIRVSLL